MVASRNTPFRFEFRGEPVHIDRSLAMATVAILHLSFAMWLLAPLSYVPEPKPAPAPAPVDPIVQIPTELVPAKLVPVPELKAPPRHKPTPEQRVVQPTHTVEAPIDAPWVEPMVEATSTTDYLVETATGGAEPSRGVPLAYESASPPRYPREPARLGQEGTVLLRVQVDASGNVIRVEIQQSSGVRQLDQAAQRHVQRHWRFHPAMQQGRPVAAWALVPIEFRLSD